MKNIIIKYKKIIKYTISSLICSAIEGIIFAVIIYLIFPNHNYKILIATIIGRIVSTCFNFIINKFWCFNAYGKTLKQSILFGILFAAKLFLSYYFVNLLSGLWMINTILIKIFVDLILFFVGYLIQNYVIFKILPQVE